MERSVSTIEFTLRPTYGPAVSIRLRRLSAGWAAVVLGSGTGPGVGRSARQALSAALQPLGQPAVTALLTDPGLLAPSVAVLHAERAAPMR